jgi:hypothetical protein
MINTRQNNLTDYYFGKSPEEIVRIRQRLKKINHNYYMIGLFLYDPITQKIYSEIKNKSNILSLNEVDQRLDKDLRKFVNNL